MVAAWLVIGGFTGVQREEINENQAFFGSIQDKNLHVVILKENQN